MADDVRQIRELVDSWIAAAKAHDLPALLDMMTDDVIFMTPGRPPFAKAEFAADSERMKAAAIDARADVREIEVFGPRACIRNHIEAELTFPGQAPRHMSGSAMTLAQRRRWPLAHCGRRKSRHARISVIGAGQPQR